MLNIKEEMITLQKLIFDQKYYVDIYMKALAKHAMTTALIESGEYSRTKIISMCNTFWMLLPENPAVRRTPFFKLCDIAEAMFDEDPSPVVEPDSFVACTSGFNDDPAPGIDTLLRNAHSILRPEGSPFAPTPQPRHFNHGTTSFPKIDIAKIEEIKNAKFVCELSIMGKYGWTDQPAQIYYQETPPVPGYSNYFGLIYQDGSLFITSGDSVVGIPIEGIETPAGEIIWSRFRHDFRSAKTAAVSVDGGLDYLRLIGDITTVKKVILTIKKDKLVVVEDEAEIEQLHINKKAKVGGR